ncbi:MAG TPA: hypothetical protein VKU02_19960, partial [Gemmataceae bacterium]|nr:hypothetical protein [Gemmataceae bacterium]
MVLSRHPPPKENGVLCMATKTIRCRWLPLAILGVFGFASLMGCGGIRRVPVSGTVTLDGKPLNGGILGFIRVERMEVLKKMDMVCTLEVKQKQPLRGKPCPPAYCITCSAFEAT